MSGNKITNSSILSKSNHKIIKFITIILSILIIICVVLLIVGFVNKFEKLSKNNKKDTKIIEKNLTLHYPKNSQIISIDFSSESKLLLRYQINGKNEIILIDLINKEIISKINFRKSNDWKIE